MIMQSKKLLSDCFSTYENQNLSFSNSFVADVKQHFANVFLVTVILLVYIDKTFNN